MNDQEIFNLLWEWKAQYDDKWMHNPVHSNPMLESAIIEFGLKYPETYKRLCLYMAIRAVEMHSTAYYNHWTQHYNKLLGVNQ